MPFPKRDAKYISKLNHMRAKYRKQPVKTEENLEVIAMQDRCWCGEGFRHDWPGKGEGKSHPR